MTVVPKYETIKADEYKTLPPKQSAVECILKTENGSVINKVLSVSCDANLLSVESMGGEARYSGRIDFKALYEDGNGEVNTIAYYADFSDKEEDASITPLSQLYCCLTVADSRISSVSKDEIKITCIIEALVKLNNIAQIPVLAEGEGFLCNVSSANLSNLSGGNRETCEISDEFEEKVVISKMLLSDASVIVTQATAGVDSISVEGEAVVMLTYLFDDETKNIDSCTRVIPFKHELETKEVLPNDKAFAECVVKTLKINAVIDEEKNLTSVNLSLDLEIMARAYNSTCVDYVDDVFSTECKLNMTYTGIRSRIYIASFNYKEKIEGAAVLDEDMPMIENIFSATGSRIHIANIIPEDGAVTVEGIAVTTVLYGAKEGERAKIASVNVEIPFSQKLEMEGARKEDSVSVCAAIFDVEANSHKGKEINVKMLIKIRADLFADEVITVLSDIEVCEGEVSPQSSISVYCPGENERLWDIAKQLGVSPETIMTANPDLKFPASGTRVFIYRQKY